MGVQHLIPISGEEIVGGIAVPFDPALMISNPIISLKNPIPWFGNTYFIHSELGIIMDVYP